MTDAVTASPHVRGTALATAVALARSVLAYVVVVSYVAVVGPVAMALALLFRSPGVLFVCGRIGVRLALALVGIRYRVAGQEHLPDSSHSGVVFCSNHQSNVDPPVLFLSLHRRLRMLYKAEFDRIPIMSHAMRLGRYVPIDRRDRRLASRAIDRAAGFIREGASFLVFAEGTRSRTGELLPFKKGVFIMAILAQAPVVPVAITGARDAMRKGSAVIRPVTVSIRIGPPVQTTGMTVTDRDRLVVEVRSRIEALLSQGPVE